MYFGCDAHLVLLGNNASLLSAFIIAIHTQLQPGCTQLRHDVLWMVAKSGGLNVPEKPSSGSPWTGPNSNDFLAQILGCLSLRASLLAPLVAVLAKQRLNRHSLVNTRGSLVERSRDRQRKMDGMATWRFKSVIECLSIILQLALLLLSVAVSGYLFVTNGAVGWVSIGFVAISHVLYFILSFVSSIYNDRPFWTPFTRLIQNEKHFVRRFSRTSSPKRRLRRPRPGEPNCLVGSGGPDGNNRNEDIQLTTVGPPRPTCTVR